MSTQVEVRLGQVWRNTSAAVRVEEVRLPNCVVGSLMDDGSLARRRSMLVSTLRKNYTLKEAP